MLILTRKVDQGIVIAGNIHVRVLGVERDRVKIGISAPLEVTILRQELLERDEKAKAEAQAEAEAEAQAEGEGDAHDDADDPDSSALPEDEEDPEDEEKLAENDS